jgi:hypothetical protein
VHNQQQSHAHSQQQQSQSLNGGGSGVFQTLQQLSNVGQGFNQQQQQQFSGQMADQGLQDSNTTNHLVGGGVPVQVLMNGLAMLQQKIQQLQALVPLLTQSVQGQSNATVVIAQQQAASAAVSNILAQLAAAATGMLSQQVPVVDQNQAPNLELSQLLNVGGNQSLNQFQQSGFDCPLGTSLGTSLGELLGNNLLANNFSSPEGIGRGGSGSGREGAAAGGSGGSGLQNAGPGFSNGGVIGSGHGVGSELAQQKQLGGQQVGQDGLSKGTLRVQLETLLEKPHGSGFGVGGGDTSNEAANSLVGDGVSNSVGVHESSGMNARLEEHDPSLGAEEDDGVVENLPPGSYDLVEMDAREILAEHTHFCEICGKGFKRDANLRMHMRGHGDEYKTAAALAKPEKASQGTVVIRPRRYSCPYPGCKRNKKHRKFLPLKTMLCVKNHYRRSHCPKMLMCTKCNLKKFSVVADLKTHEKHCGRDKWQCSCGTTFSRKDKLFGHIGLFRGHTPATPMDEMEEGNGPMDAEFSVGNDTGAGFMSGSGASGGTFGSAGGSSRATENGLEMGLRSGTGEMGLQLGGSGISDNDTSPPTSTYNHTAMLHGLFTNNFLQSSSGNTSSDGLQ